MKEIVLLIDRLTFVKGPCDYFGGNFVAYFEISKRLYRSLNPFGLTLPIPPYILGINDSCQWCKTA